MDIFAFLSWIILTILPGFLDALFFWHVIAILVWHILAFLSWIILTILPGFLDALFFWHVIAILVWHILAFLLWDLITIGIFNPITAFIWDLVACSISFLFRSIFCYWSAVSGIKIFARCWVINPNLLSFDRLLPMFLAT